MTFRADLIARLSTVPALTGVYSPPVPEEAEFPHAVVAVDVNDTPALEGDGSRLYALRRTGLAVVWQREAAEDEAVMKAVVAALAGYRPSGAFRWRLESVVRLRDPQLPFVQHQFRLSTGIVLITS